METNEAYKSRAGQIKLTPYFDELELKIGWGQNQQGYNIYTSDGHLTVCHMTQTEARIIQY